jgi:hypothetical protein
MALVENKSAIIDDELILKDAGAVTTSAAAEVDSSAREIELGAYSSGRLVLDISACEDANADETYEIHWQGSTATGFSSPVDLAKFPVVRGTTGRLIFPVHNKHGDVVYDFVRLYTTVGGTDPSINYTAYYTAE